MLFPREKKELWRYASKNYIAAVDGTTSQPPQPHRRQHQRPLQRQQSSCVNCGSTTTATMTISSYNQQQQQHQQQHNTPPPPYSSVPCGISCSATSINQIDYRLTALQQQQEQQPQYATDAETETSVVSTLDSEMDCVQIYTERQLEDVSNKRGYNYENYGDAMHVDDCEQANENSNSSSTTTSSFLTKPKMPKHLRTLTSLTAATTLITSPKITTATTTAITAATTTTTTTFVTTAANMFRNCCGVNLFSTDSSTGTTISNSSTNSSGNIKSSNGNGNGMGNKQQTKQRAQRMFDTLMKQLKKSQISALLKAVKSRVDTSSTSNHTRGVGAATTTTTIQQQTQCILIQRSWVLDEEPYVIACRLFFWRDLRNATQLKRLPVCPNEHDPVYVCCNPLHWCRVLEETAPPPYQRPTMERLITEDLASGESSLNGGNSNSASTGRTISSMNKTPTGLQVQVPESLSTDGEDLRRTRSWVWCEVAYWELSQRVGQRFSAQDSSINIFADGPSCSTGGGGVNEGMCLKELVASKTAPTPDDVKYTRQKIGLGLTLSQETDGVWLYNRSTVPIFLYSPTLSESWYRVCRVLPGECLKAFDNYRAQSLNNPAQLLGTQTGPVNAFSMRISFAKGWGCSYKRQDITRCPCWLEVFFNRR